MAASQLSDTWRGPPTDGKVSPVLGKAPNNVAAQADAVFAEIIVYRYRIRLVYEGLIRSVRSGENAKDQRIARDGAHETGGVKRQMAIGGGTMTRLDFSTI